MGLETIKFLHSSKKDGDFSMEWSDIFFNSITADNVNFISIEAKII